MQLVFPLAELLLISVQVVRNEYHVLTMLLQSTFIEIPNLENNNQ